MNIRSKKLMTIALIALVLPFVTLMSVNKQDVAAESPTINILNVTSTATYRIDVTVELTLIGFNYDYYIQYLRLYLNQSADTIIANSYNSYNSTLTFDRKSVATFEARILSLALSDESAKYNITLVTITNTGVKSSLTNWVGGYYFIDIEAPTITFINPAIGYEEIWGNFTITVEILDDSNLSLIQFFVNNAERYRIEDPTYGQTIFTWDYECYKEVGTEPIIKVTAKDDTPALNSRNNQTTVKVVGPKMTYLESIPAYIDSNDTLLISISAVDQNDTPKNISYVEMQYQLNDGPWQTDSFYNDTMGIYNYTFPELPVGTKITWRIFANNTLNQYHILKDNNFEPFYIYSVYPDHIDPVGYVEYDGLVSYQEIVSVFLNVTEQSPVNQCLLRYKIQYGEWNNVTLTNTTHGIDYRWYGFEYNFTDDFEIFDNIYFYIWLNDSAGNELLLDNSGNYYRIKILPLDLNAPNITIVESPERIVTGQNITITVNLEDESNIDSVILIYIIDGIENSLDMLYVSSTGNNQTWTISFTIEANTGDNVEIFVRVVDEYYNTRDSNVLHYEVESTKNIGTHSNAWIWLLFIAMIIIPLVVTFLLLKPKR
ncbi:MAG: hypothetical protein ACFFDW_08545 [Candidatus Thorarchaeota archaeon]